MTTAGVADSQDRRLPCGNVRGRPDQNNNVEAGRVYHRPGHLSFNQNVP